MPSPKPRRHSDDFDSPWKDALQLYFRPFQAFFFADIHAGIDWSRGYEALDKEFQQIIRQAKRGKGLADKLFKVCKDLDALAKSDNPIAAVVRAHLLAQQTRKDPHSRKQWKVLIFKELLRGKWSKEDIRQLFRLIDWIMYLPPELEEAFRIEIHEFEEENKMSYVPSYERLAHEEELEKGREEGMLELIELDLVEKFGRPGRKVLKSVRELGDLDKLRQFARQLKKAKTLEEIRDYLKDQ